MSLRNDLNSKKSSKQQFIFLLSRKDQKNASLKFETLADFLKVKQSSNLFVGQFQLKKLVKSKKKKPN